MKDVNDYDIPGLIERYVRAKGISKVKFAEKAEIQRVAIYNYIKGAKMRQSTFDKMLANVPDLLQVANVEKLYSFENTDVQINEQQQPYARRIPVYDIRVFAKYGDNGSNLKPKGYIDTLLKDVSCSIQVAGDSMAGDYWSGDYLLLKEKNDMSYMVFDREYVIVTTEEVLFKYVCKSDKEDEYILKSANEKYSDIVIPKTSVLRFFHIERFLGERRT